MTEKELIKKCIKGSRVAQEALYRIHAPVLYGICLKYSRNKTEAEDNLHDSFMTIYEKIHQYKYKGSFEGWLKRVTINTVLQKYRKKEPLKLLSEIPDQGEEMGLEEPEISLALLLKYVQELPQKYRLTFNMYVMDGFSHKEISEALGTSEGTSKSNLSRARMILQEKILKKKQIA
ncbi:RNA polymerase sigma factor [Robiginitalea sp.]|uniref:RNA polymerase sigma factor n=1 Tax=Robiginitalea sp. TaxID=1902411 RepID=UPI003C72851E